MNRRIEERREECLDLYKKYDPKINEETCIKKTNEYIRCILLENIDYTDYEFKRRFLWYMINKPNEEELRCSEKAIKKVVPELKENEFLALVGFIFQSAYSIGGDYRYCASMAETYCNKLKCERIFEEMLPDESKSNNYELEHQFEKEMYKDGQKFNEKRFREIINNYINSQKKS